MEKQKSVIGLSWYRAEDYDAILGIMSDSNKLPDTFGEWLLKAENGEKELTATGHIVVRAVIDPKTFPDWCRSRSLNIDSKARMEYANLVAKERAGNTHCKYPHNFSSKKPAVL